MIVLGERTPGRDVPLHHYLGRIALIGLFCRHPDDWSWFRLLIFTCQLSVLRQSEQKRNTLSRTGSSILRVFDGRQDSFICLNSYQSRLKADLLSTFQQRHVQRAFQLKVPPIAINIRLGKDFAPPPAQPEIALAYDWVGWLQQTPIAWFIETLELIRLHAGWSVPAIVVSDGDVHQLSPILNLPSVTYLANSNAAVDLIVLSRSSVLLGSGSSSFCAWAAFLGQQPCFTAPGHPFSAFGLESLNNQMIASFDPRNPDEHSLAVMCAAVSR